MKKAPVAVGVSIVVLALVGGLWWFWSLGNLPEETAPKTRLAIGQGSVFVTKAESGNEEQGASGMELGAGDTVRTGPSSVASVVADDRADIRLDENTTVKLEKNDYPWSLGLAMRVHLQAGRVWSRLLKLVDADQNFEAVTDDTVATVRGTALGLVRRNGNDRVVVDHGGLVVRRDDGDRIVVGGQWLDASAEGRLTNGDMSSSTWRDDPWVAKQREADAKFELAASKIMAQNAAAGEGLSPDEWLYTLQSWSESWHLKTAGKDAPNLYGRYFGRRLYQVRDLVLRGKSGLAYHVLTETEDEFGRLSSGPDGQAYRKAARASVGRMVLSMSDVKPEDALYKIKMRLEDLQVKVWSDDALQELYARSLGTDSRLDEAERLECKNSADADRLGLAKDAAEQSLKRVQSDAGKAQLDARRKSVLDDKWEVERARLTVLEQRIKDCVAPVITSTTTLPTATSTTATTTADVPPTATSTITSPSGQTSDKTAPPATNGATGQQTDGQTMGQTQPPAGTQTASLGLTRIELFAQPNPANVGNKVTLYVKGYLADGSTLDVTSKATFAESGGLGALNGSTYLPSKSGSATLMATVLDGTQTLRASVSLQVGQVLNVLSGLRLSMANGTTVYVGQSRSLTATAVYSSGYTQNVTMSVKFTADGTAGTVSGSTFTADKQITGQVTVSASYTEGGVTKTADLPINVVSGSLMQTVQ